MILRESLQAHGIGLEVGSNFRTCRLAFGLEYGVGQE